MEEREVEDDYLGLQLLESEIERAIRELKNGKSSGQDETPAEFLKNLDGTGREELKVLTENLYKNSEWPSDFTKITMITIPKKARLTNCSKY